MSISGRAHTGAVAAVHCSAWFRTCDARAATRPARADRYVFHGESDIRAFGMGSAQRRGPVPLAANIGSLQSRMAAGSRASSNPPAAAAALSAETGSSPSSANRAR